MAKAQPALDIDELFPDEEAQAPKKPARTPRKKREEVKESIPEETVEEAPKEEAETKVQEEVHAHEPDVPVKEIEELIQEEEVRREEAKGSKPYDTRQALTKAQWNEVEDYYLASMGQVVIPEEPTSTDILQITSGLDRLYTEARFDQAFIARKLKVFQRQLSDARKTVYLQIKDVAKNDKERDALGAEWLEQNPLPGHQASIMAIVDEYVERDEFMDAVVSVLKSKAEKLIVDSAAIKIEHGLIK